MGVFSLERRLRGINKYLKGRCREDEAMFFSVVPKRQGNGHRLQQRRRPHCEIPSEDKNKLKKKQNKTQNYHHNEGDRTVE